jgi:hypothetical protein
VLYPVCGGIDGHAAPLTACLRRVRDDGQMSIELVDCSNKTNGVSLLHAIYRP